MEHHARATADADDSISRQRSHPLASQFDGSGHTPSRAASPVVDLAEVLDGLRRRAGARHDPALASALDAAGFAVDDWVADQRRAEAYRHALDAAVRRQCSSGQVASTILRLVGELLAAYGETADSAPSGDSDNSAAVHRSPRPPGIEADLCLSRADSVFEEHDVATPGAAPATGRATADGGVTRTMDAEDDIERMVQASPEIDDAPGLDDHAECPSDGLVAIGVLGPFTLTVDGRRIDLGAGQRGMAVLHYLLTHRSSAVGREALIEAIWPELRPDDGGRRLHQTIYGLRQALAQATSSIVRIDFVGVGYRLAVADGHRLVVDAERFQQLLDQAASSLRSGRVDDWLALSIEAESLYRGDLLCDAPWAEWSMGDADRLRVRVVAMGNALGDRMLEDGRAREALEVFERARQRDPWNEESTRGAMRAYDAIGQSSVVRRLFRSYCEQLQRDLGVEPTQETRRLYAELSAGAA